MQKGIILFIYGILRKKEQTQLSKVKGWGKWGEIKEIMQNFSYSRYPRDLLHLKVLPR
jgi:hypothetical protein